MMSVVYWIYDHNCNNPKIDGYVGITDDFDRRWKQHKKGRFTKHEIKVLFEGTREECLSLERELRPAAKIGWNFSIGGEVSKNWGWNKGLIGHHKHSEETKKQMSKAQMGKKLSPEHRMKISLAKKGMIFSEEHRQNLSKSQRGCKKPRKSKLPSL